MNWKTDIQPVRVLGLAMREPVTLGHVLLLAELESPVVCGGQVTIGDVAVATFACAWPAEKSRLLLSSIWCPLVFKLWGRFWKPGSDGARLVEWIEAQARFPEAWQRDAANARELAAPWWINRLAQALDAGISYSDALTMPLRTLTLIVAARLEANGVAEFVTPREREYMDLCRSYARN